MLNNKLRQELRLSQPRRKVKSIMTLLLKLVREKKQDKGIFGEIFIEGKHECFSLENDELDIPLGAYSITLEDSPHFGPNTPTINNVPGRKYIRIHGGTTENDSLGCILVGDSRNLSTMSIAGAKFHHVLQRLKDRIGEAISAGNNVVIEISEQEDY